MPESYAQAVRRAERENEKNRRIQTVSRGYTISGLMSEFPPTQNLMLDGTDEYRKTALYRWIERLYTAKDAYRYPIIVISLEGEMIADYFHQQLARGELPFCRNFVRINTRREGGAGYDFGLGLPRNEVHDVLTRFAARRRLDISLWTVFDDLWDVLEECGYETSLENLQKVYHLGREMLAHLLESAGRRSSAQRCRSNADEYEKVSQILDLMMEMFSPLAGSAGKSSSLADQIPRQMKKRSLPGLPMIYFELPDRILPDFLEYLQVELGYICSMARPLVIIDSVNLQQDPDEATDFYKYISRHPGISLTLTAGSCASMFPQKNAQEAIASLDGAYRFLMILMKSTNDPVTLTGHRVKTYQHLTISQNVGAHRETFHLFRDGVNTGWTETRETRERIRVDDVQELDRDDCYVLTETNWYKYLHVAFR